EAPGTYHHSIIVGNLAEAAADAVGGDSVTVRVGAYYHDVGKIRRPYFFIENQMGAENPHDKIAPGLSTLILTSHVKDGVEMAREQKLPEKIVDIIEQHHGTSIINFFYHKALEQDEKNVVKADDFRYEGPKPQSREAAIVMLADAVEAGVRSLSNPTEGKIEGLVRKIVKDKLDDGQLEECDLNFKDLNRISSAFVRVLTGIFHRRIEYPDAKDVERRKARNERSGKQFTG
ncbi:MAG: HDIG domain-containing protein, partial [Eubacteriales bacterium]|nr:HDIG domain-containing protein [Eubacteriales bacterium]